MRTSSTGEPRHFDPEAAQHVQRLGPVVNAVVVDVDGHVAKGELDAALGDRVGVLSSPAVGSKAGEQLVALSGGLDEVVFQLGNRIALVQARVVRFGLEPEVEPELLAGPEMVQGLPQSAGPHLEGAV